MKAAYIIVAAATLSFGQTTTKKAPPAPAKLELDTWQKSKECAVQAEKVMADKPLSSFSNHYSPKYNKCFISDITVTPGEGAGKDYPLYEKTLIDAFERSALASWFSEVTAQRPTDALFCQIDSGRVDCAKAANFISEHMKN